MRFDYTRFEMHRRLAGLSKAELSKRAGASRDIAWRWRTSRNAPTLSKLTRLVDALNDRFEEMELDLHVKVSDLIEED